MDAKNIVLGGTGGGILLFVLLFGLNSLIGMVVPYDISAFGGMRAMDDPVMLLFFLYPFVVSFAAAVVFDTVRNALQGTTVTKGLLFGGLLLVIMTVPSLFVMITTMDWPLVFYAASIVQEGIGYPVMGVLFAFLWKL
ncbi:MAG: hypothetical protein ABFC24_08540 [Methanoregulaceae archaeon]